MKALHLWSLLTLIAAPAAAIAQPPAEAPSFDRSVESLLQLTEFRGVALAPDGKRVAWVQVQTDKAGPSPHRSAIFVADVGGGKAAAPRRIRLLHSFRRV